MTPARRSTRATVDPVARATSRMAYLRQRTRTDAEYANEIAEAIAATHRGYPYVGTDPRITDARVATDQSIAGCGPVSGDTHLRSCAPPNDDPAEHDADVEDHYQTAIHRSHARMIAAGRITHRQITHK